MNNLSEALQHPATLVYCPTYGIRWAGLDSSHWCAVDSFMGQRNIWLVSGAHASGAGAIVRGTVGGRMVQVGVVYPRHIAASAVRQTIDRDAMWWTRVLAPLPTDTEDRE